MAAAGPHRPSVDALHDVLADWTRVFVDELSKRIDVIGLTLAAGISLQRLTDAHYRVPADAVRKLWSEAERRLRDPRVGLTTASRLRSYDLFGYLLRSQATVGDALAALHKLSALLISAATIKLERRGDQAVLSIWPELPVAFRHIIEYEVALICGELRRSAAEPLRIDEVHLRYGAASSNAAYNRFFDCRVSFGGEANLVVLPHASLAIRLSTANRHVASALRGHAIERLKVAKSVNPPERVEQLIRGAIREGTRPSRQAIARHLGVSEKTLQRRLDEAGLTFRDLVDTIRRHIALELLHARGNSVREVAVRLGFSDSSAFGRAFRRWTGHTPGMYDPATMRLPFAGTRSSTRIS